jgi:hypothetical protein
VSQILWLITVAVIRKFLSHLVPASEAFKDDSIGLLVLRFLSFPLSIMLTNHSMTFYYILSYDSFSLVDFFLTPFHLFKLRLNTLIYTNTFTLVLFNLTYADQGLQSTSFLARLVPRGTLRLLFTV